MVVSSGVKNYINAKSLNFPVSLFLICLTSLTGTIDSNSSSMTLYSMSQRIEPLIIRLQFSADSSLKGRVAG